MSGCCTHTGPCSGSARASCTWRSSGSEMSAGREHDDADGRLEAIEALARLGAGTWLRTARWYAGTGLKVGGELLRVVDRDGRIADAMSDLLGDPEWLGNARPAEPLTLRERGERLLEESA